MLPWNDRYTDEHVALHRRVDSRTPSSGADGSEVGLMEQQKLRFGLIGAGAHRAMSYARCVFLQRKRGTGRSRRRQAGSGSVVCASMRDASAYDRYQDMAREA